MAIAGVILSAVAIAITVVMLILAAIGLSILNDAASGFNWGDLDF